MCVAFVNVDPAAVLSAVLSLMDCFFVLVPLGTGCSDLFFGSDRLPLWALFCALGGPCSFVILCDGHVCVVRALSPCGIAAFADFAGFVGFALLLPCALFAHLDSLRSRVGWPCHEKAENRVRATYNNSNSY